VVDVGLQSDVINVSFLNPDPTVARDAVKSLLDQFFGQEATVYANPQLKFAEQEANRQRDKLNAAQQALAQFKNSNQIADLNAQVSQLLKQRTDVESRLNTAQGRVSEAEQREAALKELLSAVPATVTTSAVGEQFRGLDEVQTQIATLKAKRDQMASTYQPGSPVFRQLDASIGSLEAAAAARNRDARGRGMTQVNLVYENIKTDLLRASAEAQSARQPAQLLATQLGQINQRMADLERLHNQYDDLQRSVSIQDAAYRSMAIRLEEARAEANRNAEKISAAAVIAAPVVPEVPARPRRKLVAFATVLTALLLACGGVLAAEAFDDRLRSPRDVTQVLRVPVLATFSKDT
jgi:succinoglycan biosynthesis transport protein ExoP